MAPMNVATDDPRVIVFTCDQRHAELLDDESGGVRVVKLPCVGMLPPSFVDFALSRRFADGVMLAGCAENDCFHRLGNEWTIRRMARERDPYLRQRVPVERVQMSWLPPGAERRSARALQAFRARLRGLPDE